MKYFIRMLSIVCTLLLSQISFGQEVKDSVSTENFLEMSLAELMDVEIKVASKSDERATDASSSVSVFTKREIENLGVTTIEELLNFVPGFVTTRDDEQGNANRIAVRGRGSALSESVLFLLNGHRINDLYSGGVSIINRMMAVENIEQIEIIRGPGSALYGSNAFLGVVNIVTSNSANEVDVAYGSQNAKQATISLSGNNNDLIVSGFAKISTDDGFNYDNLTDIFGNTTNTSDPYSSFDIGTSISYKGLSVNLSYMERRLEDFMIFGAISNYTNKEYSNQGNISADYLMNISDKLQLNISSGYHREKWQTTTVLIPAGLPLDTSGFALEHNFLGGPYLISYGYDLNVDLKIKLLDNNNLLIGGTYMNEGILEVENLMTHNPITLDYQGGLMKIDGLSFNEVKTRNVFSACIQDQHTFGDILKVTIGARFDNYDDFGSSFNPRAAIIYTTPINSKVKAMYATAFRAPNFLELYDKNNPVDFGQANLDAENISTLEFSYIQEFEKFQLGLTYYKNEIKNLITLSDPFTDPDNPLGAPAFINAGTFETSGLEAELKFSPISQLQIRGSFSADFDSKILYTPPVTASLYINYNLKRFNINLSGIYRDKMELVKNQDGYLILNAKIWYALTNRFRIYFSGKNLSDTQYKTISSIFEEGVPNRGRMLYFGLNYKI